MKPTLVLGAPKPTPPSCEVTFSFVCSLKWEALKPLEGTTNRFCGQCRKTVVFCHNKAEADLATRNGKCIAYAPAQLPIKTPELVASAKAGDQSAIDRLLSLAEISEERGNLQDSLFLYREAASALKDQLGREAKTSKPATPSDLTTFPHLVETILHQTKLVPSLKSKQAHLNNDTVRDFVYEIYSSDGELKLLLKIIESRLSKLGVHFAFPVPTIARLLTEVLWWVHCGAKEPNDLSLWQKDPVVRITVQFLTSILEEKIDLQRALP